jgi:glycosyltransferase involved in cell wall biosynthesis
MNDSGPKALVVTNEFPFPPNHGGRVDIWRRVETLAGMGFQVDLLATVFAAPESTDVLAAKKVLNQVILVPRQRNAIGIFSQVPVQVRTRYSLRKVQLTQQYDLALLETEAVAAVLDNRSLRSRLFVLRVQNDEPKFFRDLAKSEGNWAKKAYYAEEARRYRRFIPKVYARVHRLWFISAEERDEFVANADPGLGGKAEFVPAPLSSGGFRPHPEEGRNVLFVGTLSLPVNVEALQWYLAKVHPRLQSYPSYRLVIAGNTRGTDVSWLKRQIQELKEVELVEDPDGVALDSLYRSSAVFINPALGGAGVKLKTINAIEAGLPVVCTRIGSQGTGLRPGQDIWQEETPEAFAEAILTLLNDRKRRQQILASAQEFLVNHYDHASVIARSLENSTCSMQTQSLQV